jgi:tetratricopeptide (TPR) repeat protein
MFWRRTILGHWGYSGAKLDFLFLGTGTTLWIILKYAQLLFLPLKLNALYDITPGSKELNFVIFLGLSMVILILILAFLHGDRKKQRILVLGLCWLLLTLLPVSNFVQTASIFMAERYLYLPSLGYFIIFGWLLGELLTKNVLASRFILRMTLIIGLVGLTVLYAGRTLLRNRDWKDNFALGKSLLEVDPNSATGHHYLGMKYAQEGDNEKAKKEYLMALKVAPNMRGTHYNLGIIYFQERKIELAKEEFKRETEIDSLYAEAYYNLGTAYRDLGQLDSSIQAFQKAVDLNPDFLFALENLASLYEARGLLEKALPLWEKALKLEQDPVWISRITERIRDIKTLLRTSPQ